MRIATFSTNSQSYKYCLRETSFHFFVIGIPPAALIRPVAWL